MTSEIIQPTSRTQSSRYALAGFILLSLLVAWSVLRVVLFLSFGRGTLSSVSPAVIFLAGAHRDLVAAAFFLVPLLAWYALVPSRWWGTRLHRAVFWTICGLWGALQLFLLAAEFFFFEEFKSRFNTVAVDYVLYPKEVFINIWEAYPVVPVVAGCLAGGAIWAWVASRRYATMWSNPTPRGVRWLWLAGALAVAGALSRTVTLDGVHVGPDRTLNELANNGFVSLISAAWTRQLDYTAFYKTIPPAEAYQRVRRQLASSNARFTGQETDIRRTIAGDPARPRLNVVILLEESLGSEFWGCLGATNNLTPEMDRLANEEGLLFTNLYASGNRTVRGLEGVLSSFPPLPGDSILKMDKSDRVETIGRVLKREGYNSVFLYGGRGVFDGMRSFTVRNGYDQFVEQKHFKHPGFSTIWGVCDEEVFARAIEEFRALDAKGTPFLGTVMSVSNHKPYTYPSGRIPEDPKEHRRRNAVKYSDYALGQFFKAARKERFWTNTVFAVVADHGARVYGSMSIPIHSYEIPLVILGPAVVRQPARIDALGCSLDVSPTILGLIGRPYESTFFGRDLLREPGAGGRAFINHNRDIGLLAADRMVVLGLQQGVQFYGGDPKGGDMHGLAQITPEATEAERDTIAFYQVAHDLYSHRRYCLDDPETPARAR